MSLAAWTQTGGVQGNAMESSEDLALSLCGLFGKITRSPMYRNAHLLLNTLALANACDACTEDLGKYCAFHGIGEPDAHKKSAFIFKWICRFRPVYSRSPYSGIAPEALLHVNSWFALAAAMGNLDVDAGKLYESPLVPYIVSAGTYTEIKPRTWAMIFFMMECSFGKKA